MKILRTLAVATLASITFGASLVFPANGQAKPSQLATVLSQMDAASTRFKSAEANFQWDYYEKIVHDTSTDKGTIYFERAGSATNVGAVMNGPDGKPKQTISFAGSTLELYTTGDGPQLQVFDAGSSGSMYQGFLTLGFGGSGAELTKNWTVTDGGPETLTIEGQTVACEKLNLVPKDPGMAKNFKNVVMWVDTARGIGVRQIFYTASGNYRTATYSNVRLNTKLDKGKYGIDAKTNQVKTAKGTQIIKH